MARARKPKFDPSLVVVDTRESLPLGFPGSAKKGLPTGDYTVIGMEDRIVIERKTLSDLYACVGRERARFERELERMAAIERAGVVVEASFDDLRHGTEFSRVHPHSAINSLLAWWVKYNVPFWLVGNRRNCRSSVYHVLRHFWRYHHEEPDGHND